MPEDEIKPEDISSKLETSALSKTADDLDWLKLLDEKSDKTKSLESEENQGILGMRRKWSNWVLGLIVTIVLFDMVLVILYGRGVLKFDNPSVVIAVITDNFLKIVGLGFLITREIFKKIYR